MNLYTAYSEKRKRRSMNSVSQTIKDLQKRLEALEQHWESTIPSTRLEDLMICAHSVEALIAMCEAEDGLLNLLKDRSSHAAASKPNQQHARSDELSQTKDKLLQCVKMLAQVGRTSVSHMSTILGITEEKASELLNSWKNG